jgi:hypothetical protein
MELIVENLGEATLYIYVYDLSPLWQVKGILHASYEAIPARNNELRFTGRSSKKIRMTIPSVMSGCSSCEDIVKVFITSRPSSFESLELPSLDEVGKTNVRNRVSRPNIQDSEDWMALDFHIRTSL